MSLEFAQELNRLAGTTGLSERSAANAWAGTTGLSVKEALSFIATNDKTRMALEIPQSLAIINGTNNPQFPEPLAAAMCSSLRGTSSATPTSGGGAGGPVAYWNAKFYSGSGSLTNQGTGGSALDLTLPGGTNDPKWLAYAGEQYAYMPGIAGNYVSTPDSAAVSVTGDIEIIVRAAPDSYATASQTLVAKYVATGNQKSYLFVFSADTLTLYISQDGASAGLVTSTATTGFANGAAKWFRVTWTAGSGLTRFYTAADSETVPTSWDQLGADRSLVYASIFDGTAPLEVGNWGNGASWPFAGKVYRALVYNGIDGTLVADYDPSLSVEPHSTFTASTGEVWTHNRTASGRKLVLVDRNLFLFGTDDYLSVADDPLLDFAAGDAFTALAAYRVFGTTTSQMVVAKRANDTANTVGWKLDRGSTANTPLLLIDDGAAQASDAGAALTQGVMSVASGVRDISGDTLQTYTNTTAGSSTSDTTTATIENATVFRVGADAGGRYADMEFMGAAVFRRALSAAEIAQVVREFGVVA